MKIPSHEFWLPLSIRFSMGEPIVKIAKTNDLPQGFSSDLDISKGNNTFSIPLMDIELDENTSSPAGLIFHLPRSGSTAFAKSLGELDNTVCLFEPNCINELLTQRLISQPFENLWLEQLISLYTLNYARINVKVFIKLSSWSLFDIDVFHSIFPETPFAFVYRNPIEVLVQIIDRPTGWMTEDIKKELLSKLNQNADISTTTYCCLILEYFCKELLKLNRTIHLIPHHELSKTILSVISHFAPNIGINELKKMSETLSHDSEIWNNKESYQPDSANISKKADKEIITQIKKHITPLLELIENKFNN